MVDMKENKSKNRELEQLKRCAILQMEAVHEGIVPSLVKSLNAQNYKPQIYINRKCEERRGDIFKLISGLNCDIEYTKLEERDDWRKLNARVRSMSFEFVMASTFQSDPIGKWISSLDAPVVGVVHNVPLFLGAESCVRLVKEGRAKIIVLADHVAVFANHRLPAAHIDDVAVIEPVYLVEPVGMDRGLDGTPPAVAVPGSVSFRTRWYEELVEVLGRERGTPNAFDFTFRILGSGPDMPRLSQAVSSRGLEEMFRYLPPGPGGQVLYADYFAALATSTFVHPLLPFSFPPYREHKITLTPSTSIGLGIPTVLDRWTARTYRFPCIVSDAGVEASLRALAVVTPQQYSELRGRLLDWRDKVLQRNDEEMGRLLARLPV